MHELTLSGIPGSNPIGAMAAFGLFRIIAREQPFGDARLSWRFDADWRPVLHTTEESGVDAVVEFLISRQKRRTQAEFLKGDDYDLKHRPHALREQLSSISLHTECAPVWMDEAMQFLAAFGSDGVTFWKSKEKEFRVKPTAFHLTSGKQQFLTLVTNLSQSLDIRDGSSTRQSEKNRHTKLVEAWAEVLCGPWKYADSQHSLGWDPTTENLYALRANDPNPASNRAVRSVRGAVWLAFESLPLFPSVPGEKKLLTTGFNADGDAFRWPVWEPPISLDSLRALFASSETMANQVNIAALRGRGITTLFQSQCIRDGNGRGTFRNAVQIH